MNLRAAVPVVMVLVSSIAVAHEGHGHPEHQDGVMHYLVNPSHFLPGIIILTAIVFAAWRINRKIRDTRRLTVRWEIPQRETVPFTHSDEHQDARV